MTFVLKFWQRKKELFLSRRLKKDDNVTDDDILNCDRETKEWLNLILNNTEIMSQLFHRFGNDEKFNNHMQLFRYTK